MQLNNNHKSVSNSLKLLILFVDYAVFGLLFLLLDFIVFFHLEIVKISGWFFIGLVYFLFFTLSEHFFNRTIGMKLFKVSIENKKRGELNKSFIIYSLLIILDRFLLIVLFYFFRVFFHSKENLLLSEKYSGLRWIKNKMEIE